MLARGFRPDASGEARPWQAGVHRVEEVEHLVSGMGARTRLIAEDGTATLLAVSSYTFEPHRSVRFGETDESGTQCSYCVLEKLEGDRSRLTIEVYLKPDDQLISGFEQNMKAMVEAGLQRSLENMGQLVEELGTHEVDTCAPVGFQ
jgi:hypothetical protein